MKPPNKVLRELVADRLTFDGGCGKKILTKLNVWRLIMSIACNSEDARIGSWAGDKRKGRRAKEVLHWPDAQRLRLALTHLNGGPLDWSMFHPQGHCGGLSVEVFAQFETLKEMLQHYRVKLCKES